MKALLKTLGLGLLISSLTAPALAIGLGKVSLHSELSQPLNATVTIIGADDYSEEQLIASIADKKIFEKMGVEMGFNMYQLKMRTGVDSDNNRVVFITTQDPVNEPYLEFVLSLKSPEGQSLKTVALLLDAPKKSNSKPDFRIEAQ